MPELPEVETVRSTLAATVLGRQIASLSVFHPAPIKAPEKEAFCRQLCGRRIEAVRRRGKYLLLDLDEGCLVVHLRMTGQLIWQEKAETLPKHTHLLFSFADGSCLRYTDQRRFGGFWLWPQDALVLMPQLQCMGPEPLSADFCVETLSAAFSGRRAAVKSLLLDQRVVAGLGNIYADESLFRAGIVPMRPAESLNKAELSRLHAAIREVLEDALSHRGTSFSDYLDAKGKKGEFQDFLRVYQREGAPCRVCGSMILREKIGGRSSFYCPHCQE